MNLVHQMSKKYRNFPEYCFPTFTRYFISAICVLYLKVINNINFTTVS